MFDCGAYKSQYIDGQREKFGRLDDLDSMSMASSTGGKKKVSFSLESLGLTGRSRRKSSKSFKVGVMMGSEGLLTFGRTLKTGVTRAVFPVDLKVSEKKIFDPQDKSLQFWTRLLMISCIFAVSIDLLFFYLPVFNHVSNCLAIDDGLAVTATILRTAIDGFYLFRMALQFRTAYIAPSSRIFGQGELVIDPAQIASRYLQRYFVVDFLSVLPLPQVLSTKQALLHVVFVQYIPRFVCFIPLNSEMKKTSGAFAERAFVGAAYYLLWYMLASHITGAFWYLLAVERNDTCWQTACTGSSKCNINYLYCGNKHMQGFNQWESVSDAILNGNCSVNGDESPFNCGNYMQAVSSGIVSSIPGSNMDESLLDAICERPKPSLYTENTYIVLEGDPVNEMIFIIRGRLESVTTDGVRSGFFNRGLLKEADFCSEELLTWALDPNSLANLPSSTRTVRDLTEVEAFALEAEELKFVASQFRRLHSRQVQHTFRFYSQQWRTWASSFIQAAWRRHLRRKRIELQHIEEEEEEEEEEDNGKALVGGKNADTLSKFGGTVRFAQKFKTNIRRVQKLRSTAGAGGSLVSLQKPSEPDFSSADT